ncbi:MAG: AMP-binding protein [Candidatus Rokubacteria bacterium]|nr:AMP-binding protein [Candidatus Rokubacteria bacterium]
MTREWFSRQTIGSLVDERARVHGHREALCFKGTRWTFARLAEEVDRAARGLIALGIEPGDKVALWMLNRPEWMAAALAVIKIGAVLVPINTRFRTEDVRYVVGQSDSVALIIAERSGPVDYLAMVRELLPSLATAREGVVNDAALPLLRRVIVLGDMAPADTVHWPAMLAAGARVSVEALAQRAAAVDPDATAFFMYTSGTTGFPKGVMHSHVIVRNIVERASRMAITFDDDILMYLPLYHLFGFSEGLLMSLAAGARQVLMDVFDAAEALRLLEQERATVLHGFDTHFKDLLEAHERAPRDVSSIRTGILASGMSSSFAIARKGRQVFGPMVSGYGMSEFCVGVTLSFPTSTEEQCVEASGYPAPGYEIRVLDQLSGKDQPVGVPGEILVRGYTVMQGYYKKPEETARTIDADGWVHTGDMGLMRPDGHMRFMGRYKDMLKIGGENVDPMEVEAFLMTHPAINLAAVVAYPDARLSEVGVAFVRLEADATVTEREVLDYCRGKIASFKIPRHVFVVDDFPWTGSGKIQKVKLREDALRRAPPSASA